MESKSNHPKGVSLVLRSLLRFCMVLFFVSIPLFAGAGTLDWPKGWLFLGVLGATMLLNLVVLMAKNPVLLEERWKRRKDTKKFDKIFGLFYVVMVVALLVSAGLDSVRFQWTEIDTLLISFGFVLHVLGLIPILWAMLTNPHLETTVRIQNDRNHQVISTGPYMYIRHPMYTGMILMYFGWPLILGSWMAFIFSILISVLFFIRTSLEDNVLQKELAGYTEFCKKTRYRLIPGLW